MYHKVPVKTGSTLTPSFIIPRFTSIVSISTPLFHSRLLCISSSVCIRLSLSLSLSSLSLSLSFVFYSSEPDTYPIRRDLCRPTDIHDQEDHKPTVEVLDPSCPDRIGVG